MRQLLPAIFAVWIILSGVQAKDYDEAIRYNARTGVSLLIMVDGQVVAEDYPGQAGPDDAWPLASGTKSFCGVIAALAVKDGLLSLDELAADTLTEWQEDERAQITVRDLLSLTSGLETPRPRQTRGLTYQGAVALPAVAAPGEVFAYGPSPFQAFGEIMRRKLNNRWPGEYRDAADYLNARVLSPAGVTVANWARGRDGYARLNAGAEMTAQNWARFGQFVLDGGVHEEEQLVDRETLREMAVGTLTNPGYGLTWWLNQPISDELANGTGPQANSTDIYTDPRARDLPDDVLMAAGAGKQRLYIIPSRNMVIVRQQRITLRSFGGGGSFSDVELLSQILN